MGKTNNSKMKNGEKPENGNLEDTEEVEGYYVCKSHKERCLADCLFGPILSVID